MPNGQKPLDLLVLTTTAYGIFPKADGFVVKWAGKSNGNVLDLVEADFHGHERFPSLEAARGFFEDLTLSERQILALGRKSIPSSRRTPWGQSQGAIVHADGIEYHSTSGHGGYKLDRRKNAQVHPAWRNAGGWYEAGSEWSKVALTFPHLFSELEKRDADRKARDHNPDGYEAAMGVVLEEGQSWEKDRRLFEERHKDDLVVISATGQDDGRVFCIATRGGKRQAFGGPVVEEHAFFVPKSEYPANPKYGFVIDPARHEAAIAIDAPLPR